MNARTLLLAATAAVAVMSLPRPALAQAGSRSSVAPVVGTADRNERREQAPPALPGARAGQNPVAPSDRPTSDLQPNDALFDAINRGDLPVVKDAISRGADLNATNVLGLTPLELSIDLGRNDISFLLLSLRGATGSTALRAAPQQGAAAPDVPVGPTPAQRRAQAAADRREQAAAQRAARAEAAAAGRPAAPVAQAPALFAGNGGTPNPQAGFVGFGR